MEEGARSRSGVDAVLEYKVQNEAKPYRKNLPMQLQIIFEGL